MEMDHAITSSATELSLTRVVLVCKQFHALATPYLYRRVTLKINRYSDTPNQACHIHPGKPYNERQNNLARVLRHVEAHTQELTVESVQHAVDQNILHQILSKLHKAKLRVLWFMGVSIDDVNSTVLDEVLNGQSLCPGIISPSSIFHIIGIQAIGHGLWSAVHQSISSHLHVHGERTPNPSTS
jgi:hypothetical protein